MDRTLIRTYLNAYIAAKTLNGRPDRAAIEAVLPAVREQLGILDRAVEETGYLVGNQFTFADINLMPILERVRLAPEGAEALSAARHLAAYYDAHAARPSFAATVPPPESTGMDQARLAQVCRQRLANGWADARRLLKPPRRSAPLVTGHRRLVRSCPFRAARSRHCRRVICVVLTARR
jgi:Glutathione S-transferase, C-terminal domain